MAEARDPRLVVAEVLLNAALARLADHDGKEDNAVAYPRPAPNEAPETSRPAPDRPAPTR
jgi:hypothetical protein